MPLCGKSVAVCRRQEQTKLSSGEHETVMDEGCRRHIEKDQRLMEASECLAVAVYSRFIAICKKSLES